MAVLGLRFCARVFSSCGKRGPLTIAASLVAEHRLQTRRLSNCGSRAQLLRGMWDLPRPGLETVCPALAGRLSTTAPPGKPLELPSLIVLHGHREVHLDAEVPRRAHREEGLPDAHPPPSWSWPVPLPAPPVFLSSWRCSQPACPQGWRGARADCLGDNPLPCYCSSLSRGRQAVTGLRSRVSLASRGSPGGHPAIAAFSSTPGSSFGA